jgi:hypothetical protein
MEEAAMDIFLPVMESAVVLAAHYCKAAGRDCVQGEDMRIGLMFAARNVAGKHLGTLYPEVYDEDSDSGSGEWVTDTRPSSRNPRGLAMRGRTTRWPGK